MEYTYQHALRLQMAVRNLMTDSTWAGGKIFKNENETNETKRNGRNETKQTTGEDTYAGALRAPRAGSPVRLFRFVRFVSFHSFRFISFVLFVCSFAHLKNQVSE